MAASPEIEWLKQAAEFLAGAGPYGAIAILLWVAWMLWGVIKERDTTIAGLQDRRADEAGSATRALTEALAGSAESGRVMAESVKDLGRLQAEGNNLVRLLPPAIAEVSKSLDRLDDRIGQR